MRHERHPANSLELLDRLVTAAYVAAYYGITVDGLAKWRAKGKGPEYIKINRRDVRYKLSSLIAWEKARTVGNTAEAKALHSK